jgi:hypothetical protein
MSRCGRDASFLFPERRRPSFPLLIPKLRNRETMNDDRIIVLLLDVWRPRHDTTEINENGDDISSRTILYENISLDSR